MESPQVMIVDDSEVVRKILSTCLKRVGIASVSYSDGYEVLSALKTQSDLLPSMIILDLHMPKMDGYALARLLRSDPRFDETPLIFLTGYDSLWNRLHARVFKRTRYLLKPFTRQDILGIVFDYVHMPPKTTEAATGHIPYIKGGYHGYTIVVPQS